jgi:DNA-binding IclR family transcriptional regulator
LLSTFPPEVLKARIQALELKRLTAKTITSKSKLLTDINEAKERGWFVNREESLVGVVTVSGVFRWNNAVHLITVAGPEARIESKIKLAAQRVVEVCRTLGESGS